MSELESTPPSTPPHEDAQLEANDADSSAQTSPTSAPKPPLPKLKPLEISAARRRSLRSRAHHLRPTVQIGQAGITEGVIGATKAALEQHELIKVSINSESPTERKSGAAELGRAVGAHVIQVIGRVLILFREADRSKARRPKSVTSATSRDKSRAPSKSKGKRGAR